MKTRKYTRQAAGPDVTELVSQVLASIRRDHYADRVREYMRDQRALTKAIARYGYECFQRGWHFETPAVLREIMTILMAIRTGKAEVQYMPRYLEGAIDRHVRGRAEELGETAKAMAPKLAKIIGGVAGVEAVREKSATEALAEIYRAIPRPGGRKRKKPAVAAVAAVEQGVLLWEK